MNDDKKARMHVEQIIGGADGGRLLESSSSRLSS